MNKKYKVEWYINDKCNQDCSYCLCDYSSSKTGFNELVGTDEVHNLCSNLLCLGADFYYFVLLGGEPTIYPDLPGLIDQLNFEFRARKINIMISTNAKVGQSYFKDLEKFKNNLTIRFSMHPKYYSDKWFDTIDYFLENNFDLQCDVLYDLEYKSNTQKTLEKLLLHPEKNNFQRLTKMIYPSSFQNISNSYNNLREISFIYGETEINKIKEYNRFFKYKPPDKVLSRKYCLVGSNKINVDYLGHVLYFCKFQKKFPSLFYLSQKKFKENIFFVKKCPYNHCHYGRTIQTIQSENKNELEKINLNFINGSDKNDV